MAIGIAAAYLLIVGFVWLVQDRLIYYPEMGREIATTPAARGVAYDDFTITTEDGERLSVWWVPATSPRGAVLLLHGNAGNISQRTDYALMFRELGYSTLLVDYRGYGRSTGKPSEEGTYRDADAAWRWLTRTRHIPENQIVVFGESLGGGVASWIAARHRPRALVLASTFTSATDLGAEVYGFLPVRLISRFRYATLERLRDVTSPILIMHSPDDDIIPYAHGRKLFEAANEPKAFVDLAGGHNSGFVFTRPEWVKALGDFLRKFEGQS
ncbi:MAG TPA: alpha/beta hydrolase [Burkholderiales bacterium]|nr:alpha/beta hydrolase [Burkholderiales bacterium]